MKNLISFLLFIFSAFLVQAQIITLTPSSVGADDAVTLTFDATQGNGELVGQNKVYLHHGVVIDAPDGTDWNYVIGNWGADDGVGEMTPVAGEPNKWEIEFSPTIRSYFGVPANENIFRISCVFRSADGNLKGTIAPGNYGWGTVTPNSDIYVNLNAGNFVSITNPTSAQNFLNAGEDVEISAVASSNVSSMKIWLDEGAGYVEYASVSSGTSISYTYSPSATIVLGIKITATINGEDIETEKFQNIVIVQDTEVAALPPGLQRGINYDDGDDTKVFLVLEAPGKEYVYAVGDFTDWNVLDDYQMKVTADGELFWLEIDGLTPLQEYVFQYWMDNDVKVGDPYADKVADPWNDQWIEAEVYPNLPEYNKTEYSIATVLQTGQTPYNWDSSEDNWQRPDLDHLTIYELHVRDFLKSHNYQDLIDTLSYLKRLGVQAIELMPVSEFEGNDSWGYNPSYYFAPDKYYGTKDDLKDFIQAAHQEGLAVILDMVLNHAYGENAMVKMYYNSSAGKPAADNPWFNEDHVGPYAWGFDFNHETDYTKAFIDLVNAYWLNEYHFDGFRFDFTKGFTNYAPGGNIDTYDQSRIDILKRMADQIWTADPEAYIILEHWGPGNEEAELGNYGMKMWRNRSYDHVPVTVGNITGSFNGMDIQSHVSFFDSHDERRIAEHALTEGLSNGPYNIKDPLIMYERVKMAAAFLLLSPGPKMMWQFDELGYDIDINFNGRVGLKPLPWGAGELGYYENPLRQYIYDAYQGILDVRNQIGPENLAVAATDHKLNGAARRLSYNTSGNDLVVVANYGLSETTIDPAFTETGNWFDYFSGENFNVSNVNEAITLKAGEWHIYTSEQLSTGFPGVVEVFDSPVTISPDPFSKFDEITITFDATKAWKNETDGLVGANQVYFHSGVILEHPDSSNLENVVGTFMDDGIGEMTEISEDIWEITITPGAYYSVDEAQEIFKIGMWFRDANNTNEGYGFRNSVISFNVQSDQPFVTIDPPAFDIDTEITVTFNARRGNQELVGANKVYLHSGSGLLETNSPWNSAWTNVVGNWGQDDGVGQMSPVANEPDIWEITFTPRSYYGLDDGDFMYWMAAVFRNADGSVKGTGTPGEIENGIIHTDQDFFLRNQGTVSTSDPIDPSASVFPNPTDGYLNLSQFPGVLRFQVFNTSGQQVFDTQLTTDKEFDLSKLSKGIYFYRLQSGDKSQSGKVVVF